MQFKKGCTRFVVLYGNSAIKIARIRPIRPFIRLVQLIAEGRVKAQLHHYDSNATKGGLMYLLNGVLTNRAEFEASIFDIDLVVKTHKMFLGGLVIIQERGSQVLPCAAKKHPFWKAMLQEAGSESAAALQFAQFKGNKVLLIDLGQMDLICPVLATRKM